MTRRLLSFGHGYSAQALAQKLLAQGGWQITGTTRNESMVPTLVASGTTPLIWPGEDPGPALSQATHLLISTAPSQGGDPVLSVLAHQIAARAGALKWVGYLSTTAVYGDHQGGWVDETTPLAPATRRGQLRVEAEAAWQKLEADSGLPLHIFRLAGIYGPGRGPFAKLSSGTARCIVKPGQVFSRIHVDDIAQVLAASISRPDPGAIYNVCDDDPAPPEDVIAHAASLLGMAPPPSENFADAEMTPMARSFYAESKRVSNTRIKAELGIRLKYPTYQQGLAALLAQTAATPSSS